MTLQIRASATIEQGVITNRVRVKRAAEPKFTAKNATPAARIKSRPLRIQDIGLVPRATAKTYRSRTVVVALSIPPADLIALDEACKLAQMTRSAFLRQAAKHFAERIKL